MLDLRPGITLDSMRQLSSQTAPFFSQEEQSVLKCYLQTPIATRDAILAYIDSQTLHRSNRSDRSSSHNLTKLAAIKADHEPGNDASNVNVPGSEVIHVSFLPEGNLPF